MPRMTIAAALSRKLYETLGPEAAEAMVDWMQRSDAGRVELRELHELTTQRFEARLDARFAALDARTVALDGKIDRRLTELDRKNNTTRAELKAALTTRTGQLILPSC